MQVADSHTTYPSFEDPAFRSGLHVDFANESSAPQQEMTVRSHGDSQSMGDEKPKIQVIMTQVRQAHRCCLVSNLLIIFGLMVVNITGSVIIRHEIDNITRGTSLADLSKREMALVQMALNAILIMDSQGEEVRRNFEYFKSALQETQENIWTEIAEAKSLEYQRLLTQLEVPTWRQVDHVTQRTPRTLVDALQNVLDTVYLT